MNIVVIMNHMVVYASNVEDVVESFDNSYMKVILKMRLQFATLNFIIQSSVDTSQATYLLDKGKP